MNDFYAGKKVLVTGGTGLIGVPLVHRLVQAGASVSVASLDSQERANRVLPVEAKFMHIDLTDGHWCTYAVQEQDYVFHLAGIKGSVALGKSRAASFFVPHLLFNTHMMEAAYRAHIKRYLYTSSIGVYPENKIFREDEAWNGPPFGVDIFPGYAKRMGELQAEAYRREFGWSTIAIVRPANVYGPCDNFDLETAMVIPALMNKFRLATGSTSVWGNGTAQRDFVYADDVAEGMMLALEKGAICTPINLGSGYTVTIREIAETICTIYDKPLSWIQFDTSKPAGEAIRLMDVERASSLLGWRAKTPLLVGLKATADWLAQNEDIAFNRYNVFKENVPHV